MENKTKFTDKAKKDLKDSVNFYEEQKLGLGESFLISIKEKSKQIQSKPEVNPADEEGIRKAKVKVFPFYIYYIFKIPVITIIAIWHVARLPFSKSDRIESVE